MARKLLSITEEMQFKTSDKMVTCGNFKDRNCAHHTPCLGFADLETKCQETAPGWRRSKGCGIQKFHEGCCKGGGAM